MALSLLALSCLLLSTSFASAASIGGDDDSHVHHEVLLRRARRWAVIQVTGTELYNMLLNGSVQFTQSTIGCRTRDNVTLDQLANNIRNGWQGDPVRAVSYVDPTNANRRVWVMLDHRRTVAGRRRRV